MKTPIKIVFTLICLLLSLTVDFVIDESRAARFKVLVVMNYDPDYTFVPKLREGIDSVLSDTCRTFGYMSSENPTGRAILKYFQHEAHTFPMKLVEARFPRTLTEGKAMANELRALCDVLFIPTMNGIKPKPILLKDTELIRGETDHGERML